MLTFMLCCLSAIHEIPAFCFDIDFAVGGC